MIELKENLKKHIDLLCERYPALKEAEDDIAAAFFVYLLQILQYQFA